MAKISLTQNFANIDSWPGRLFEAENGATFLTKTAGSFVFRHPASGGDFPNYRIEIAGSGFTYDGNMPLSGTMSSLRILNGAGQLVLNVTNLGTNAIASDLSQFYSNVFGGATDEGPGPNADSAWGHLFAGNDVFTGTSGDDRKSVPGLNAGNDVFNMGAGDDYVGGSMGKDTINGGDGYDTLSFSETTYNVGQSATRGISVNVAAKTLVDAWGFTDKFTSIEEFRGSRFNDKFVGGAERDRFAGLRGKDSFDGGLNSYDSAGKLTKDSKDQVRYQDDFWNGGGRGIVVDLETAFSGGSITGSIRDGFGNLDSVRDIERVQGTRYNDVFVGSRTDNVFAGAEGKDSYDGQAGWDVLDLSAWFEDGNGPTSGIRIDLTKATGQVMNDGFGNVETAKNMEAVWGTDRADSVKGGAGDNELWLADGTDTMTGGGGSDTFVWESLSEMGDGDRVTDFKASGAGADKLAFYTPDISGMSTTVHLVNGTAATTAGQGTFVFNAANDTLYWDADGKGGNAMVAVVLLTGVASLSASNFEMWT